MKVKLKYSIVVLPALLVLLAGCSSRKNTGMTRFYHQLTTRYNVLFNEKEFYRAAINKAETAKKDDYTQLLPLFLYGDKEVAEAITGDMEQAGKKATKAVQLHSITAKPKVGKNGMTPEQKKFYEKREFNKYIDECYMLLGKAYVYSGNYFDALKTFNFMEAEFPGNPVLYEVKLWKAKTLILDKDYLEASKILNDLRKDEKFPNKKALKSELDATYADLDIRQKDYGKAIDDLSAALINTKTKKTKVRYRYVLAQLYLEQKDFDNAMATFREVIRMNPPYEMTFNATISMATATRGSGGSSEEVKKLLQKMLRDSKNDEFHDRIYYALAEIEMKEGNEDKAIEYYQKSASASTSNTPQKIKSYLTLADLYYARRKYVPAQAYYDSVMMTAQPDYPDYIRISSKAKNLNLLVENIKTVTFEDSVQRIARMSDSDRKAFIDNILKQKREKEEAEKAAEAIRQQQIYANASRQSTLPTASTSKKANWYFYNPATVSQGISEFQAKWGKRTLEDNWRRANKGVMDEFSTAEQTATEEQPLKVTDENKFEYYTQFLPLTDSAMQASDRKIQESLYNLGYIYSNDFGEDELSAKNYEDLIRRYPQSSYTNAAYYYLYRLYTKLGKTSDANRCKNYLLEKAPESAFAKIILDPSYLDKLIEEQGAAERLYEQIYQDYTAGKYTQVVDAATKAIEHYPKDNLAPKFAYLKALSAGKLAGTRAAMRTEMQQIVETYPKNEIATAAQEIIDIIDGADPTLKQAAQAERAKSIYKTDETGVHYFMWIVSAKEDLNQLNFDLLNFNLDHYLNTKLELNRESFDDATIVLVVKSFPDVAAAREYLQTFMKDPAVRKNVKGKENTAVIISEGNYNLLKEDKKLSDYVEFFKEEYK